MEATSPTNASVDYAATQEQKTVPVSEWFWTLFLTAIPLVGLIMLFVWAFGSNANQNKANWAKATLIWMLIITAFYVFFFVVFGMTMWNENMGQF